MDARFGARVVAGLIVLVALAGSYRLSVGPDLASLEPSDGPEESETRAGTLSPGSEDDGSRFPELSQGAGQIPVTNSTEGLLNSFAKDDGREPSTSLSDAEDDSRDLEEPTRESPPASEGERALAGSAELGRQMPYESTDDLFAESTDEYEEPEDQNPPVQASAQPPNHFDPKVETAGLNGEPLPNEDDADYGEPAPDADPNLAAGGRPWTTNDTTEPPETSASADPFADSAPQPDSTVATPSAASDTTPIGASDTDAFAPNAGRDGLDFGQVADEEDTPEVRGVETPLPNETEVEQEPSQSPQQRDYPRTTTFWAVAQREYGNPAYQRALQRYNRDHNGGSRIIAPTEETLLELYPDLCPLAPAESVPRSSEPGVHVVQPGETIFDVARKELGDAGKWRQLYDANLDVLRGGIDLLDPGVELRIPGEETL